MAEQKKSAQNAYKAWISRVYTTQKSKITPELRAKMARKSAKSVRTQKRIRKANKLKVITKKSQKAWSTSVNYVSAQSRASNKRAIREEMKAQSLRMTALTRQISNEDLDEEMAQYDDIQVVEAKENVSDNEIAAVLKQLEKEPTDDEETKAKFTLYETFMKTVEAIRKETFTFWDDCKKDFTGNSSAAISNRLKSIDGEGNLAIDFEGRNWFVHGMTVKALGNRGNIEQILEMIKNKLELLGGQDECPICLDSLKATEITLKSLLEEAKLENFEEKLKKYSIEELSKADKNFWNATELKPGHVQRLKRAIEKLKLQALPKKAHVLVCCHKVCQVCWTNCKNMPGGRRCPLCRTEDFLEALAKEAEQENA